jgi:hypothetical protein
MVNTASLQGLQTIARRFQTNGSLGDDVASNTLEPANAVAEDQFYSSQLDQGGWYPQTDDNPSIDLAAAQPGQIVMQDYKDSDGVTYKNYVISFSGDSQNGTASETKATNDTVAMVWQQFTPDGLYVFTGTADKDKVTANGFYIDRKNRGTDQDASFIQAQTWNIADIH